MLGVKHVKDYNYLYYIIGCYMFTFPMYELPYKPQSSCYPTHQIHDVCVCVHYSYNDTYIHL